MSQFESTLRRKNQLTLPDPVASELDVHPGDRLIFELDADHPGIARVRVLRSSYAGILAGVYGTPEEAAAYLKKERASWDDAE